MTRTQAILACVRDELSCRREEFDRDANLRSFALIVKFHPETSDVDEVECQRYSVRHARSRRRAFEGSRSAAALAALTEDVNRRQRELDDDGELRRVQLLVRFDDGRVRVLFERSSLRTAATS